MFQTRSHAASTERSPATATKFPDRRVKDSYDWFGEVGQGRDNAVFVNLNEIIRNSPISVVNE